MEHRCDGVYDCADESDEYDCSIVKIDQGRYNKQIPPETEGEKAQVNVSIYIENIEKIELPSTFHAKIQVYLTWTDYRLEYHNLHEHNIVDPMTEIWIPKLLFSNANANRFTEYDDKATVSVIKTGPPESVGLDALHETYIYKGSENYLDFYREYFMVFKCVYDLHNYPFDTQYCTIDLKLSRFNKNFVKLIPAVAENKGPDKLDQFAITEVKIEANQDNNLVQCKITLKRKPMYFIATTFMPTVFILFLQNMKNNR